MLYCVFARRNRAKTGYTPWPIDRDETETNESV
jgi:hypothetical protein